MPSTTHYKRGDVVLVPFPFTDLTAVKQRPALVVSSDSLNSSRADVIVVAITSQVPQNPAPDEFVIFSNELAACGLPKASILKSGKIVTLNQQLIVKRIGALPTASLTKVMSQLRQLF